ncbi:hypothetical protein KBY28_21585 [Ruegeria pomeroyi]|uniref:hypothetical protein n=1 Tax=Ruegeria pomeroyi TaxID=89184 RepID=UPI001F24ABE6|nr:hypothetical protein [Ruegeria pomeroyi]MCE8511041.1 hypothetical protein [Ruegeria pomeroyi]
MNQRCNPIVESSGELAQQSSGGNKKAPTERLILVLEVIGRFGPITLTELSKVTGISRAATWRATTVLRSYGWVNIRLCDHAFELSTQLESFATRAYFTPAEVEEAREIALVFQDLFHVRFGFFVEYGKFVAYDCTKGYSQVDSFLSLVNDAPALAALLPMPPELSAKHIGAFLHDASSDEQSTVRSGDFAALVDKLRRLNRVWGANKESFCAPFLSSYGAYGAVEFSVKSASKKQKSRLAKLSDCLPGLLDSSVSKWICGDRSTVCISCRENGLNLVGKIVGKGSV